MTCVEFERDLPEFLEGIHSPELQAHLNSCSFCAGLVADLRFIAGQAPRLQETETPSPRVWNALEAQLRREGLIRGPKMSQPVVSGWFPRWRASWMVPVAAGLLLVAGVKLYHPTRAGDTGPVQQAVSVPPKAPPVSAEDRELLRTVARRMPAQQATYRRNLDEANRFIHDAEQSVRNDPNDVYTQQLLINAYEQKQMLFDLAVDRSMGEQ
jgi:hypothetical protein